jgi:hypothetical protein
MIPFQSMDAAAKGIKVGCHHKLTWFVYDAYDVNGRR